MELRAWPLCSIDHPHYRKLIPNHLRDLAKMPSDVMKFLESGVFVCCITGKHVFRCSG